MKKTREEILKDLRDNQKIEEEKCPYCGGILVTNFGSGISCTFCVDCGMDEYDYDI